MSASYSSMDEVVLMCFKQHVAMNIPVNGPLMRQKAADLAREMKIVDWEASEEWLHRLRIDITSM